MNRPNKVIIFLLMTGLLVSSAQATVNDKPVNIQVTDYNKQNCSRYNEYLAILIVAGIAGGLFWYYASHAWDRDDLLKTLDIDAIQKEIAELRLLLQDEAVLVDLNRNF